MHIFKICIYIYIYLVYIYIYINFPWFLWGMLFHQGCQQPLPNHGCFSIFFGSFRSQVFRPRKTTLNFGASGHRIMGISWGSKGSPMFLQCHSSSMAHSSLGIIGQFAHAMIMGRKGTMNFCLVYSAIEFTDY